jgi:predicted dehydrogenase
MYDPQVFAHEKARAEQALGFELPPYRLPFESMRTDYGIGVVGLHWIVTTHYLPAYRSAGFNVVAVAERDREKFGPARAHHLPPGRECDDWHELLDIDEIDIIDACLGHKLDRQHHKLELVEAAAEAGKHVMVAKPVASTLCLAEQMEQAARRGGIRLAVNHNCRYNPASFSIKGLLTPDRLGRPCIIEVQNYWIGNPRPIDDRRGAWVSHSVHHADLIRWWADSPCVSVFSQARGMANLTIYEFENGTVAYHNESHSGVVKHANRIRVQAENGVIEGGHGWNWHLPSAADDDFVDVYTDPHAPAVRLPLPVHRYEAPWLGLNPYIPHEGPFYDLAAPVAGMMGTMGALMRGIAGDCPPDNDISKGIETLRMCLAAELSAESGRPVDPRGVPSDTTSKMP